MKKSNPSPALPLSGEGAKTDIATSEAPILAPPPDKGEAGRGLSNKTRLHNLKPQINHRKQNRKNPTEPEKCFWSWVRGKQLGCKFRRQHGIDQYIVDFYCAEHALIVELDGESHYTAEGIKADKVRSAFLISKGFRVLRFSNLEVMQNKEGVLSSLLACLNTTAIKSNPTPTLPLSGEGVEASTVSREASFLTPPPDKGEVGRGLSNKTRKGKI
jgi:very-short-patch-repair endonuclease